MKVCLSCKAEFATSSWSCPDCSWSPIEGEFVLFAPELVDSVDHYPSHAIGQLAPREDDYFWFTARSQLISELLSSAFPDAKTLLEVGCGTGGVLAHLRATHPGISLTGSDLLPETLRVARDRVPDATFLQADIRQMPYREEFDVVCALDVIEHLDEDDVALAEIARSVRPEGGVIVAVPQHMWLWGAWDRSIATDAEYSRRSLLRMFDAAGLTPVRVTSSFSLVLPLVYVSRLRSRTIAEGGDPYQALRIPAAANHALGAVMRVERFAIRRGVSLPVGSSLTVVARKGR